jgi:hypothetical protein
MQDLKMPDDTSKSIEAELLELVKRSRALSVEMTKVSERMLFLNAELARRKARTKPQAGK